MPPIYSAAYEWIGSSVDTASNREVLTNGVNTATSVPGSKAPVTIAGPTGATDEAIGGGGNSASLGLTGSVDLSGADGTGGLDVGSVAGSPSTASFASGGLTLAAGSTVTTTSADVIDGTVTVSGAGAELSVSGAVTIGSPRGDGLPIAGGYTSALTTPITVGSITIGDANAALTIADPGGGGAAVTGNLTSTDDVYVERGVSYG